MVGGWGEEDDNNDGKFLETHLDAIEGCVKSLSKVRAFFFVF